MNFSLSGWQHTCRVLRWCLFSSLLFLPGIAPSLAGDAAPQATLWVATSDGLVNLSSSTGAVRFRLQDIDASHRMHVDAGTGDAWIYQDGSLRAVGADGSLIHDVAIDRFVQDAPADFLVDAARDSIWLAQASTLFRLGLRGTLRETSRLEAPIRALEFDEQGARVWVLHEKGVDAVSFNGARVSDFAHQSAGLTDFAYDSALKHLWLISADGLQRVDQYGNLQFETRYGVTGRLLNVAPDGRGGLWGHTEDALLRLDSNGDLAMTMTPFAGDKSPRIVKFVIDEGDGSVWVTNGQRLVHVDRDARILHSVNMAGTWRDDAVEFRVSDLAAGSVMVETDAVGQNARGGFGDADGDGVLDIIDNCSATPNPDQLDADQDGYGNLCDADLNNDGVVNFIDLGIFRIRFFSNDPVADLNGDGSVNFIDLGLFRGLIFGPVGPGPVGTPSAPSLDAAPTPTSQNPLAVTGQAQPPGMGIRLYVGTDLVGTAVVAADGTFSVDAILLDGSNQLTATAFNGFTESVASNVISVDYNSTVPQAQNGVITEDVVWTSNGGLPYFVTSDLTVAAGACLIITRGVEVQFAQGNVDLFVDGCIKVLGTAAEPVLLTTASVTPSRGSWRGITIRATTTEALFDHATIEWAVDAINATGVDVTVTNSIIREFSSDGIYLSGATAATQISGNTIDNTNRAGTCINLLNASPTISDNQLLRCSYGIYASGATDPVVTGNEIAGNTYGLYLDGTHAAGGDPAPTINNNAIEGNTSWAIYSNDYFNPLSVVDATNNWWGGNDVVAISNSIRDYTEDTVEAPTIDFNGYLDGPGGVPSTQQLLLAPIAADATVASGSDIFAPVRLTVLAGVTLTVEQGSTLRFGGSGSRLQVGGNLVINGTEANPVLLTSLATTPARGNWQGIVVPNDTATATIDYAIIEWAVDAINATGVDVTVTNSIIREFSSDGIYLSGATAATQISGNTIDNTNRAGTCINLLNASPTISDNQLLRCSYGIYASGATDPVVTGNEIAGNTYGLYLDGTHAAGGDPAPTINNNAIEGNTSWAIYSNDYFNPLSVVDATNNWWGGNDVVAISNSIRDYTEDTVEAPTIDFNGYLDGPGGVPSTQQLLLAPIAADATVASGSDIFAPVRLTVLAGVTLTVEQGSTLRFGGSGSRLQVGGNLVINGTEANPVLLTSLATTPARGNWQGIVVPNDTATATIDYAIIEWAVDAINATGVDVTVTNSIIREFSSDGIYLSGATAATQISGNTIDNTNRAGTCINLLNASPTISDNQLLRCSYGIYASGATDPVVTGNEIAGNTYGLYLDGTHAAGGDPAPTINNNAIEGNTSWAIYSNDYFNPLSVVDATNNWWGGNDVVAISNSIRDYTEDTVEAPTIDFNGYLDGPGGVPSTQQLLLAPIAADATVASGSDIFAPVRLTVLAGVTLTVEQGSTLRFGGSGSRLQVGGNLVINGTEANPVLLTSLATTPARGNWQGIVVPNDTATATIDYAIIEWAVDAINATGVDVTVTNSIIREFSSDGIYLSGATAATQISGNTIDNTNRAGTCINLLNASPTISDNQLLRCSYGIYASGATNPVVTGNEIAGNTYGLYLDGTHAAGGDPAPTINNNAIEGNTSWAIYSNDYFNPLSVVDATNNWWGGNDVVAISNSIRDYTEDTVEAPTIDFNGYLDGPGGVPSTQQLLLAPIAADATVASGSDIFAPVRLTVLAGVTLTVEQGSTLRFGGSGSRLQVGGNLVINGTEANPVLLTSLATTPARGNWQGIVVPNDTATATIDYAIIEWAVDAVSATNQDVTVTNSIIREFSSDGIYLSGATAATQISGNTIDNTNRAGTCINLLNASPTISDNQLLRCSYGIYASGATDPVVTGNEIAGNTYGLYLDGTHAAGGDPAPTINNNAIEGNTSWAIYSNDYFNPLSVVDATNNWWGSTDLAAISLAIRDYTEDLLEAPLIDFGAPLDAPGGAAVAGNYLALGNVDTDTVIPGGLTYDVIGSMRVAEGATLTVSEGAVLRFTGLARLEVYGGLSVAGTSAAPVTLTSGHTPTARNNWAGVRVYAGALPVTISHATIEWMAEGVNANGRDIVVQDSVIREYQTTGIHVRNSASSQILRNLIDNANRAGTGIYVWDASPVIQDNSIHRSFYGIYVRGASSPSIDGNAITNNTYGVYLQGSTDAANAPTPTITGNDLVGNTSGDLFVTGYGNPSTVSIDANGNFWGSAPQVGAQIRFSGSDTTIVDFSSFASSSVTGSYVTGITVSEVFFSPNSDGVKDVTVFSADLSMAGPWSLTVVDPPGTVVRSFSGAGVFVSQAWDGRNQGGTLLGDGAYRFVLEVAGARGGVVGASSTTLDNTLPIAIIDEPTSGLLVQNSLSVDVIGSASDVYFDSFIVEYGQGAVPGEWVVLRYEPNTGLSFAQLTTWIVSSTDGSISLANGVYSLRVTTTDLAGNVSSQTVQVTLDLLSILNVLQDEQTIYPSMGEQSNIAFDISAPADIVFKVFAATDDQLIVSQSLSAPTAGNYAVSWDGRDAGGQLVPEEAYYFEITATSGPRMASFVEPAPTGVGSGSGTIDPNYNAHRNDFWKMTYNLASNARVSMRVTPAGGVAFFPMYRVPFEQGQIPIVWDGRDDSGNIVSGTVQVYFEAPPRLRVATSFFVKGLAPAVSGAGTAPTVEVLSDPFRIAHSYDNISTIAYRLDRDALVTVRLLPPGISDINSPEAISLVESELQIALNGGEPVDHVINWTGYGLADPGTLLTPSAAGTYTFAIEATDPANATSSLYRGALQIRR